jgi:hypothetical protein
MTPNPGDRCLVVGSSINPNCIVVAVAPTGTWRGDVLWTVDPPINVRWIPNPPDGREPYLGKTRTCPQSFLLPLRDPPEVDPEARDEPAPLEVVT